MDGGAWWAALCAVAKSRTRLSKFMFTFHFHALEKEMAAHSSVLTWRIPGMGEPGGLRSMGSQRVGHDWSDLAAAAAVFWLSGFLYIGNMCKMRVVDIFPLETCVCLYVCTCVWSCVVWGFYGRDWFFPRALVLSHFIGKHEALLDILLRTVEIWEK